MQQLIDTIRAGAPKNIIIVPSNAWDQHPGDAASNPPTGTNLMYTAHIYASNWSAAFQSQVATATAKAPVFISEWGYGELRSVVVRNVVADDRQRRRRQLDGLGHRQRLDAQHLRRRQPDHADQLRHVGEELAGRDGEQ